MKPELTFSKDSHGNNFVIDSNFGLLLRLNHKMVRGCTNLQPHLTILSDCCGMVFYGEPGKLTCTKCGACFLTGGVHELPTSQVPLPQFFSNWPHLKNVINLGETIHARTESALLMRLMVFSSAMLNKNGVLPSNYDGPLLP